MTKSRKTLFLIDAHALCYRAFFAIRELSSSSGQMTNAVYGFLNTLRKILREHTPEYMAVCFDSGRKTHRQEKFAAYKIQRPSMPEELRSQIPIIKDAVKAYNLPIFEMGGFEADDIIATLSREAAAKDIDIVIVTEDKDLFQLVGPHVRIFRPREDELLDAKQIEEKFGFPPNRIVDFLSLAGDASDNIPGVKGIGKVTAEKLIKQFGTLENILKNLDDVAPLRIQEMIAEQKDSALLSKELASLEMSVPFHLDLAQMQVVQPDTKRLYEMFKALEFRKWAEEIEAQAGGGTSIVGDAVKVKVRGGIAEVTERLKNAESFAFLLPPSPLQATQQSPTGMTICVGGTDVYSVGKDDVSTLKKYFSDKNICKITFDVKAAYKILKKLDLELANAFDVMLAAYLLNPAKSDAQIKDLVWDYLKGAVVETDPGEQVSAVYRLYGLLQEQLRQKELLKLFDEIEMPLAAVLADMEDYGVKIDTDFLASLSKESEKKIQVVTSEIYKLAGGEFNLNSPKQLGVVLFEKLKLPVVKKTKTGFSTDEEVLTKLASQHAVPAKILEYRQIAKLKSTYIDALPAMIDPQTGRVHTDYRQTGTETGRLSSQRPNLQNIPVRTELGREIRRAFIPSKKEMVLMSADYSQIELRVVAHLSGDANLKKAFLNGDDIHTYTAALVFDVPEKEVTQEMRYAAKRVNFGILYGMSSFGLAKDIGVSPKEAQAFIEKYFSRYPDVKKYLEGQVEFCEKNGYVTTVLNRRRYIPEINSKNVALKMFAQRQATNAPAQGSAADLMKLAMVNIDHDMREKKFESHMFLTVHDELVFDVVKDEQKGLAELVKDRMENAIKLSVPLVVNIKTGKNWLEMK